jgi:hypothetical protein
MKKLGILAISALLFLGVSCKKDNNSYQPDMSSNGNGNSSAYASPKNAVLTSTTTDLGGLSGTPVVNKVPTTTKTGVINGEQINPNTSTEYVVKPIPIRNDMNNPYSDPARLKLTHRHDMQNPFNDPR